MQNANTSVNLRLISGALLAICMVCMLGMSVQAKATSLADGEYMVEVKMQNPEGSERILSPCRFTVTDGLAVARIKWNHGNYDALIVDGERYPSVNREGNSEFEIPVYILNENVKMTAVSNTAGGQAETDFEVIFAEPVASAAEEAAYGVGYITGSASAILLMVGIVGGLLAHRKKKKRESADDLK